MFNSRKMGERFRAKINELRVKSRKQFEKPR